MDHQAARRRGAPESRADEADRIARLVGESSDTAHDLLARLHGFTSWQVLEKHVEELADEASTTARFERAADAVVDGDLPTLRSLVQAHPALARARSNRTHHATLPHYVAANGVEDFRQRAANILEVTKLLLDAGAEIDAANHD